MIRIIASVASFTFMEFLNEKNRVQPRSFLLTPLLMHIVGCNPTFGIPLATDRKMTLSPCGGTFPACAYHVVGILGSEISGKKHNPSNNKLIIDCGCTMLFNNSERYSAPHINEERLLPGEWVATIGYVTLLPTVRENIKLYCLPIAGYMLDIRPDSGDFGFVVPWPLGTRTPHDPDILSIPSLFVEFEISI